MASGRNVKDSEHLAKKEEKLKELSKLFESRIFTDDLINEIQKRPAIWNSYIQDYNNKAVKLNAWNSVILAFIPEIEEKPVAEKNFLVTMLQRKWKGIRACYTRELLKQKSAGKDAGSRHKQYQFFNQLWFLQNVSRNVSSTLYDAPEIKQEEVLDWPKVPRPKRRRADDESKMDEEAIVDAPQTSKRRGVDDEEEIALSKNATSSTISNDLSDEDKLFLLSLVSEMHKVPGEKKLKVRADIIGVIAAAQGPSHQGDDFPGVVAHSSSTTQPQLMSAYDYSRMLFEQNANPRSSHLRTPSEKSSGDSDSEYVIYP